MYLIFRFYANALSINTTQHMDITVLDLGILADCVSCALDMCQAKCTGMQSFLRVPAQ